MHFKTNHFINGKFCREDLVNQKINPSDETVIGEFPEASKGLVDHAVSVADDAFRDWKKVSRVKRSDIFYNLCKLLERDQKKIAEIISLETGKSLNEANAEVTESLHMCQWVSGQGRQSYGDWMASEITAKDTYVMRKPKGVVAVISPWNFPFNIGSFWCAAPAIMEGNTVVHKPSEFTPFTAEFTARLYQEAGFPPGVYNVIHGGGNAGSHLVKADGVKTILFTGSATTGRYIRAKCADKFDRNCSTETGSKSAVILFEDGNQDLALEVMVAKLSGQRCVSSGRLLIQESVYNNFCEKFVEIVKSLTIGDPFEEPSPYFGPLINETQMNGVQKYNANCCENVLLQGKRLDRKGYYLSPHVYKAKWGSNKALEEEVFGPHVALVPFKDITDAIAIYNDTPYGLALGVVTDDFRKMRLMREECNAGMIYFNGGSIGAESHLPFTGINKSGNGYSSAAGTYEACTHKMTVTINHECGITWAQGMK